MISKISIWLQIKGKKEVNKSQTFNRNINLVFFTISGQSARLL